MGVQQVKRWDVYDIADALADLPGMVSRVLTGTSAIGETAEEIYNLLSDLEKRLWQAAERGGSVGPWPEYKEVW